MVRIKYVDFWPGANNDFYFTYLSDICEVYEGNDPDFIICSCFGDEFLRYDCPRILYLGENIFPDFNLYDYAFGFHRLEFGDRYMRYPLYAVGKNIMIAREKHLQFDGTRREKFCNFIYSNNAGAAPERERFFRLLSEYKHVDSGGGAFNNIGYRVENQSNRYGSKVDFQKNYRFSIAFENSSVPGYITEKIVHAWVAGTIPIYWGAPDVALDFNPASFINCHDYNSFEDIIRRVDEVEKNDKLYAEIMRTPIYKDDSLMLNYRSARFVDFLRGILTQNPTDALRRTEYGYTRGYVAKTKRSVNAGFPRN